MDRLLVFFESDGREKYLCTCEVNLPVFIILSLQLFSVDNSKGKSIFFGSTQDRGQAISNCLENLLDELLKTDISLRTCQRLQTELQEDILTSTISEYLSFFHQTYTNVAPN